MEDLPTTSQAMYTSFVTRPDVENKICHGPELVTPERDSSELIADIERQFQQLLYKKPETKGREVKVETPVADSTDSLDIDRRLADLVETLNKNMPDSNTTPEQQSTGPSSASSSWVWEPSDPKYWDTQRGRAKSLIDRKRISKFLRNSRDRLSYAEIKKRRSYSSLESDVKSDVPQRCDSAILNMCLEPREPRFLRLAYDRSTVCEGKVSSDVSIPTRPQSAFEPSLEFGCFVDVGDVAGPSRRESGLTCSDQTGQRSERISEDYDEGVVWNWLKEFEQESEEVRPAVTAAVTTATTADAECQTHLEYSPTCWREPRMRETTECEQPLQQQTTTTSSNYRPLVLETSNISDDENMSVKDDISVSAGGGAGSSRVSSWLRHSMRRVRHFNLSDPTGRVRSAPPDSLRTTVSREHIVTESPVSEPQREVSYSDVRRPLSAGQRQYLVRRDDRPNSAPVRRAVSNNELPTSVAASPEHSVASDAQDNLGYESDSADRQLPASRDRGRNEEPGRQHSCAGRSRLGHWPHSLSSILAGLGCTLGLFNISRFAILSVQFGANFIIQFLLLSLVIGVPLLAFHMSVGQTLGAGPVDVWKISPLFQGIGIALLIAQTLLGIYSVVGVSWIFVYFRDSFITKQDRYRWAEPYRLFREDGSSVLLGINTSWRLEETVPDYLNGVVLQRQGLAAPESVFGSLKFQLTFNLAVIWMVIFVSLSKGLRSYAKVVYMFSLVPVIGTLVLSAKFLGLTPIRYGIFPATEWSEFFLNTKSWISAANEVMLTWALLGAASMQVASHNRTSTRLWRDVSAISFVTISVLLLVAFVANTCHQLLYIRGYTYIPSSFERMSTYTFLRPSHTAAPPSYATTPVRWMPHSSLLAGERVNKPGATHESGYQVIRLATELVPAALALLGADGLSPFWAVLFYFTMILFGVAQQLAIWHTVITGIMAVNVNSLKGWETTITFFTCAAGFVLGLPMATELGVFVVYFLDYCVGSGWWVVLITLVQLCAILMIRGRPYSGEQLSVALFGKGTNCVSVWAIPVLVFSWNVIMPVSLLIICIAVFKNGGYREIWTWKCSGRDYWPLWAREVGVLVQLVPLLSVPFVAVIQSYRYLSTGPPDIFDRIANLYRPTTDLSSSSRINSVSQPTINSQTTAVNPSATNDTPIAEDPPPKYTPPPSYSTATGSRIAKMLRQSIRRSVRRLQAALGPEVPTSRPPPPDYSSVLVEMNQSLQEQDVRSTVTAAEVASILRSSFRRVSSNTNTLPRSSIRNSLIDCGNKMNTLPACISNVNLMSATSSSSSLTSESTPTNSLVNS